MQWLPEAIDLLANKRLERFEKCTPLSRKALCGTGRRVAFVPRWPPLGESGLWRVVASIGVSFDVLAGV